MCKDSNFSLFLQRDSDKITIEINSQIEVYEIIKVLEFNSDRKMMSIILRNIQTY